MWIILIIILIIILTVIVIYNKIIKQFNLNKEGFSNVDVALKQRYDLIPNLESLVKGYANYEKGILEDVTKLRQIQNSNIKTREELENNVTNDLKKIFAIIENYPELKANQTFLELQNNLVKVEETIEFARRYYNGTTREYNTMIQKFPNNIIAKIFKFQEKEFFTVDLATRENPKINE